MPYLHQHFNVEQIALFGSFAHQTANENSDIDIMVSLSKPLGFAFMELANYLEGKLGRRVDIITKTSLEMGMNDPHRSHIARDIQKSLIYV